MGYAYSIYSGESKKIIENLSNNLTQIVKQAVKELVSVNEEEYEIQ